MTKHWTKHIIVEGVDCSGKTTLAQDVVRSLGYRYHHEGVPSGSGSLLQHYSELLMRDEPTVFDRLHVGEVCYGPVMRGQARLSDAEMKLLQRLVMATGTVVVICDPPLEVVINRWVSINRDEYVTSVEKFAQVWRRFHDFYALNCYHDEGDLGTLSGDFPDPQKVLKVSQALFTCPIDVVGSPAAKYLFVGERCNAKPGEFHLPFFSTSGSSGYLNDRLQEAGFKEADIAFTNAQDVDERIVNLRERVLPDQTVIALGAVAHIALEAQNIRHTTLPHPQYFKRFRSKDSEQYVEDLRKIRQLSDLKEGHASRIP